MEKLTPQEREAIIESTTRALGYVENGGKPDLNNLHSGKSGEMKSIFQFTPATWKGEAAKYLGDANAPLTPDNETSVVMKQVGDWVDKGYTIRQIASMWNAGHGEPDAYTGKFSDGSPSVGVNKKYGVRFNVPAYANSVNNYAKQFYVEKQQQNSPSGISMNQPGQNSSLTTPSLPTPSMAQPKIS